MNLHDAALAELTELEDRLGHPLHAQPVHEVDQWTAGLRDTFTRLDTDLADPVQARAAFAGAYVMASVLFPGSNVAWPHAIAAVHLWRHLADRTDGTETRPPQRRRRWWRR